MPGRYPIERPRKTPQSPAVLREMHAAHAPRLAGPIHFRLPGLGAYAGASLATIAAAAVLAILAVAGVATASLLQHSSAPPHTSLAPASTMSAP